MFAIKAPPAGPKGGGHLFRTNDRFLKTDPKGYPAALSRVNAALEAFRRNPTDGNLAPTPARVSAESAVPLVLGRGTTFSETCLWSTYHIRILSVECIPN